MSAKLLFVSLLIFSLKRCIAQDISEKAEAPISVSKKQGNIIVDGLSNEPAWQGVTPIDFFVLEPIYGAAATEASSLLITYDEKNLYIAARCYYKDSTKIIARNFVRDGWRGDDWFAFDIDSRNDKQSAIRFALYPFGTHFDMAISNDGVALGSNTFNINYDLIWEGKSVINKQGWFMEMKIPFSALRFKSIDGKTIMNISATRQIYYNNEQQHFPKVPQFVVERTRKPSLNQPFLFNGLKPSHLFYLAPSVSASLINVGSWNSVQHRFEHQKVQKLKPSLDLKYSLSTNFVSSITLNTDFSQAEVDEQQVNHSRFSLFYPEKRQFFQEEAGLFEFKLGDNSQLFYSRNIGLKDGSIIPILGGARINGTIDKSDIGIINVVTNNTSINDSSKSKIENFGIVRTRHKVFNSSSYIGTMFTSRFGQNLSSVSVGTDAVLKIKGSHYVLASIATSNNSKDESSANLFSKSRINIVYDLRKKDKLFYTFQYGFSGKDFNPAVGFTDRTNFHNFSSELGLGHFGKTKDEQFKYKSANVSNIIYLNGVSGSVESFISGISFTGQTFRDNSFKIGFKYNYESLLDTLFIGNKVPVPSGKYSFFEMSAQYEAPQSNVLKVPVLLSYGSFFDGRKLSVSTQPAWSINKFFELSLKYNLDLIKFNNRNINSIVHTGSLKVEWAFNLHLSGQLQVQYNSAVKKIFSNAKLRYHFSDGHDLYLVFNGLHNQDLLSRIKKYHDSQQEQLLFKYTYTFH